MKRDMTGLRYAVLDVETTTGDPTCGRVMEVAVLVCDGTVERVRWDTLVDPRSRVPAFTRRLTGITDSELRHAPRFSEVARTLRILTEGRIVVAHNVRFDMTALAHEFARTGLPFEAGTLCTERLARRLVPGLQHYNLGSLCDRFGIPRGRPHRAMDDALATRSLIQALISRFGADATNDQVIPWRTAVRA